MEKVCGLSSVCRVILSCPSKADLLLRLGTWELLAGRYEVGWFYGSYLKFQCVNYCRVY